MAEIKKISVALTAGQIDLLKKTVEAGEYATTSEIIREALRDWQFRRIAREEELKRLRAMWDESKASGDSLPVDFDAARLEARRRLETLTAETAGAV
jgi:antitoxin ParD1/3/4